MQQKTISELAFKDLYVQVGDGVLRDAKSRYNPTPTPGSNGYANLEVPEEYTEDVSRLRVKLMKAEKPDFAVAHDGIRLRVARYPTAGDQEWCAMRRFPRDLPILEKLNFGPGVLNEFRSLGKRSGLIVIGGATGAGKTTTGVGLLVDYLSNQGGLAYTIEDPVEYMMQGPFIFNPENAFVMQREVHEEEEWALAIAAALRSAPKYIFLGEVRTPAAARQLLRASNSGHLVMCTVHGGSVEQTLSAIIQIAEQELGPLANTLLADGLTAVVHQQLINGRAHVKMLKTGPEISDPIRQAIRAGKLQQLGTQIAAQETNRLKDGSATPPVAAKTASPPPAPAKKKGGWFG